VPAPVDRPGKIIAVGLNYKDHASEQNVTPPERPMLFAKWQTALIGPGDAIVLPSISDKVDYEAELGVVIGERAKAVPAGSALDVVAGYICVNDVSARDLQYSDKQFTRAKSLDTFCPVGPRLVPASEVGDSGNLKIRALLNGEVMQDSSTSQLIFSVPELIAFISEAITLEPGDLIATGTPAGVGTFRDPPIYLKNGDEIVVEIERVGELRNPVRAA
jgi:2,4-didehydro-3-deoxy-L-rhamnonate hydrolase